MARSVQFQGYLPVTMVENTAAGHWAGSVQLVGDPSQIALIDVVGDADLYIDSSFDPMGGTLRAALREVVSRFAVDPIITPQQDILLSNIADADRAVLQAVLVAHGVTLAEALSPLRRW
jgi:hypothetical protein